MPPSFVAITGGPGSGKTSVIRALSARGHPTVPESAIEVIAELNAELGLDGQRRWRAAHRDRFQDLVLARQLEAERAFEGHEGFVFLDRGRLDGLAYLRHFGETPTARRLELLESGTYAAVFLLATLSVFTDRSATGRTSDRRDSLAIAARIEEVYREHGHEPIHVPEMPIEERADFVLSHLPPVER